MENESSANHNRRGSGGIERSSGVTTVRLGNVRSSSEVGDAIKYTTRMACFETLFSKMGKYPSATDKNYNENTNYTGVFNSWLMSTGFLYNTLYIKNHSKNSYREAFFEIKRCIQWDTSEGLVTINVQVSNTTKRSADNKSCWDIFQQVLSHIPRVQIESNIDQTIEYIQDELYWRNLEFRWRERVRYARYKMWGLPFIPRVQMDTGTTEQGDLTQSSNKQENTIITQDQSEASVLPNASLDNTLDLVSSEKMASFRPLTNRWMPLASAKMSTSNKLGENIASYYFPEAFYKDQATPNLAPFEAYIYGRMEIEIKLVVNANKFCCGKLIMSSKYDSYQADMVNNGYQSALARNHVIVDVAANNEGRLRIPFRYHRPLVRLVKNDTASKGVRPGKYCSVYVQILSPLQTGPDGASEIELRAYYRLVQAQFTGMSFRVAVQMFGIEQLMTNNTRRALKEVLVGAEKAFDQLGKTNNQDKPGTVKSDIIVPRPRANFCGGKGIIDVHPLRLNPYTLTNYEKINVPTDEPRNYYELARIWGIIKSFQWSADTDEGSDLLSMILDPTCRNYYADYNGEPTPVEYACSNFAFWAGTLEVRLDFVSNSFHTGTVQITAEFGRKANTTDKAQSSSTYTKNFHLGDQKSVTFVVPYIYDTVMRRNTNVFYNPYDGATTSDDIRAQALSIAPESHTTFRVRVMNQLRPAQSAPQAIDVLMFIRAGENFSMHGLIGNSCVPSKNVVAMDKFPLDGYRPTLEKRDKREASGGKVKDLPLALQAVFYKQQNHSVPDDSRNEWNEYLAEKLPFPIVQMETADNEDKDPTENFNEGLCALPAVTLDCHMDFKDLLRRPTLLIWNEVVKKNPNGAFFIPLMPPSRDMSTIPQTDGSRKQNTVFATSLRMSTAMNIMDMFRCWRGSMRYTIVVDAKSPVYVSLIPHSGVRIIGNHQVVGGFDYPICGSNFVTEMIVPSVNPTITIEAPYDTENTWTLTFDEDAQRNYSWRDKGDGNAGHLAIMGTEDFKLTVWWSAGDDFTIANFYGIPHVNQNGWAYRFNDTHGRVQMGIPRTQIGDFRLKETFTRVTGFPCSSKFVTQAAVAAVPVIGVPLTMARGLNTIETVGAEAMERVGTSLDKVDALVETLGISIGDLSTVIKEAVEKVTSTMSGLCSGVTLLYDFMLDIVIAWMEQSWRVVGIAIVRMITKILPTRIFGDILHWGTLLGEYVGRLIVGNVPQVQMRPEDQQDATLMGILLGLVGSLLGVTFDERRYRSIPSELFTRLTTMTGVGYLVHVLRFVQATFSVVRDLVFEGLGFLSPEAKALEMLSKQNDYVNEFVKEAQIITSESNRSLLNAPRYRNRVWKTVLQAYQIQRLILQVPTNVVSGHLARLCSEVVKFGNENFMDLSASPVRYEPFVVCIEGPPGTGKSHATEDLVENMLHSIGFNNPSTENVYYRVAGEKFWSGYRDQPVIVYDEWLNTTSAERNTDQIVEIMKLKSTSLFIPEMAHLDEKKIRGNPLIIIILCNNAFPNISDYARTPVAVFRRRDLLLRCERTPEYQDRDLNTLSASEYEAVQRNDKPHLRFSIYTDPKNRASLKNDYKSYVETTKFVINRFQRYHTRELAQVRRRMEKLPGYAETIEGDPNLADPFTLFYHLNERIVADPELAQNGWTPYEMMEMAIVNTNNLLASRTQVRSVEPPSELSWSELGNIPQTQGLLAGTVAFCLATGAVGYIASVGLRLLQQWELEARQERTEMGFCSVCHTDTQCAYICRNSRESENKHLICIMCYRGLIFHSIPRCPMCRDPHVEPWFNDEDQRVLTLWLRLATIGKRGVTWFLEKIVQYYNWRHNAQMTSYLLDLALGVIYAAITNDASVYVGHVYAGLLNQIPNIWAVLSAENAAIQMDSWDETDEPGSSISTTERVQDELTWALNNTLVDEIFTQKNDEAICRHAHLTPNVHNIVLTNEGWIYTDRVTNRRVILPLHMCQQCFLTPETYQMFIEHWANVNKMKLRHLYIDYINNPVDSVRERVPLLFRPSWMHPIREEIPKDWWTYLSEQYSVYKTYILYTMGLLGAIGTIITLYQVFQTPNRQPEVQYSGTAVSPEPSPRHRRVGIQRSSGERRYFQSGAENPSVYEVCAKYVVRNMMHFELILGEKVRHMFGTGLFGTTCLIPRHYVREIQQQYLQGAMLYGYPQTDPQLRAKITIAPHMFVEDKHTDLAYIKLPPKFPLFKDLRKFCALDTDFDTSLTSQGTLLAGPREGAAYIRELSVDLYGLRSSQVILDQNNESFEVHDILVYNYSQPGVCGSILLRDNHVRPILSMHIAGVGKGLDGEGYGVLLTQEALDTLSQGVPVVQLADMQYESVEYAKFVYDDDVHLRYLGSLPEGKIPHVPTKSKLVKSVLFGVEDLSVPVEPAILAKQDIRYTYDSTPLYEGVIKHGQITQDFREDWVVQAQEQLWDGWISSMKSLVANPKRLTYEEAIVGFPGIEFYKGMDLHTSAGYPYMLHNTKKSKGDYIDVIRDSQERVIGVNKLHPELLNTLQQRENMRREGIVPHTIFVDTLKDEKRKTAKVLMKGGTRVFCNAPLDNVIATRQNFLHFIAAFMAQRHNLQHAVGINPTSSEWTRLTNKLLSINNKFIGIDYSNFGPGYNSRVAKAAYDLMIRWIKENTIGWNANELECLVLECIQSIHVCNNTVYQQFAGSPSGAVFTTIVNTMVNQLYLLIAWNQLIPKQILGTKLPIQEWRRNVCLYAYGDDALLTVRDNYLPYFNARSITTFFSQYGITATDADKSGVIEEWIPLSKATFLKRGFLLHPFRKGEWLSPLSELSIKSATQWVWKSANIEESTLVNCNAAMLQAHGHGPEFYTRFKNTINRALLKLKLSPVVLQWQDIDELFYTEGLEFITDDIINDIV